MSYMDRDTYGMYKNISKTGPGPLLMGANTLIGDDVYNNDEESLGEIKELMLDTRDGSIAYAVLSFGGILGLGKKLFAVPWQALTLDTANKRFLLNVDKKQLENAPGFDKDQWPNFADTTFTESLRKFYNLSGPGPDYH